MPGPVVIYAPVDQREHLEHEGDVVVVRAQGLEHQHLDDGWTCSEVPPLEPLPEWVEVAATVFGAVTLISICAAISWVAWAAWQGTDRSYRSYSR